VDHQLFKLPPSPHFFHNAYDKYMLVNWFNPATFLVLSLICDLLDQRHAHGFWGLNFATHWNDIIIIRKQLKSYKDELFFWSLQAYHEIYNTLPVEENININRQQNSSREEFLNFILNTCIATVNHKMYHYATSTLYFADDHFCLLIFMFSSTGKVL
jgi:hypothetical protein